MNIIFLLYSFAGKERRKETRPGGSAVQCCAVYTSSSRFAFVFRMLVITTSFFWVFIYSGRCFYIWRAPRRQDCSLRPKLPRSLTFLNISQFLYIYTYIYTYTYTYTYTDVYVYVYVHVHTHVRTYVRTHYSAAAIDSPSVDKPAYIKYSDN